MTAYKKDEKTIQEALDNFKAAQVFYGPQRAEAREDLRFLAGSQRPANVEPFYSVNLLHPFLRQITASAREANPSIEVIPVSTDDLALSEVYSGIIRSIEERSDASTHYANGLWYAAASGEGYALLDTDYISPDGFDQEICIKGVKNPEKVFLDPNHIEVDGSDAEWGFIVDDISHQSFKRMFPRSQLAKKLSGPTQGWQGLRLPSDWLSETNVRIARYYCKHYEEQTLYLYEDPISFQTSVLQTPPEENEGLVFLQKRKSFIIKVKAYVLSAYEVLDETYWPGSRLPIFKFTGDSYTVGGKSIQHGAIRFAKDPQRQFNFFLTKKTELIDLIPKVPFVAAAGQIVDNPDDWANAHRVSIGTLTYKPVSIEQQLAPPPTRPPGIDGGSFGAISAAQAESLEHLKLVFGMHGNPAMDQANNESSGVALQQRFDAASRSVYQYFDNELITLRAIGRSLVELIPLIYDTDRVIRIVKPDSSEQLIAINSLSNNLRYDLTKGSYDVVVKTGPSFANRRDKSLDAATKVLPYLPPNQVALVGDQMLRLVNDPATNAMADRIKASQPPEVLAASGDGEQEEMAPAALVVKLQQELGSSKTQLQTEKLKNQELQVKIKLVEDKTSLELVKHDGEMQMKSRQLEHDDALAELEGRIRMKQLDLEEEKLALEKGKLELQTKQMQINATLAANKVVDGMKPVDIDFDTQDISSSADIGGSIR